MGILFFSCSFPKQFASFSCKITTLLLGSQRFVVWPRYRYGNKVFGTNWKMVLITANHENEATLYKKIFRNLLFQWLLYQNLSSSRKLISKTSGKKLLMRFQMLMKIKDLLSNKTRRMEITILCVFYPTTRFFAYRRTTLFPEEYPDQNIFGIEM